MKFHSRLFVLLTLALVILQSTDVSAIGLRGPLLKDTFFFEPNLHREYDISFYTNSGQTQNYELYVRMETEGLDLTEYVTLDNYYFENVPTGRLVDFHIDVDLPSNLDVPGFHEIRVGARELPDAATGMVSAVTASEMRIIVIVLQPGHYLVTKFTAPNANVDEEMKFSFGINNYGTMDTEARGDVKVFDKDDKLVGSAIASPETIASTKNTNLIADFSTIGLPPASYKAVGTLYWYDQVEEFEKEFKVGTASVVIEDLSKTFLTEAINKFRVRVQSGWNNKLKNVFATVNIFDSEGNIINTFSTPSAEIPKWESAELYGYFDTTGLLEGDYKAIVSISFDGGKDHHEEFTFTISEEATTETVEEIPGSSILTVELLLVAIIVLLMVLISLLLLLVRKNQKPEKNGRKVEQGREQQTEKQAERQTEKQQEQ